MAGLTTLFSCSDSDTPTGYNLNGVKVVSANTSLEAAGGDATIEVNKPITKAYAADSWLTVSVDASSNKVVATSAANESRESRSTTVVVKASDTDSTIVNVSQLGLVFNYQAGNINVGTEGGTFSKYVKSNVPLTIMKAPEWVDAKIDNDSVRVTVNQSEPTDTRMGFVVFGNGEYKDSIKVSQISFDNSVMGKYFYFAMQLSFDSNGSISNVQLVSIPMQLTTWSGKYYMSFPNYNFQWLFSYDKDNAAINFNDGQYVGKYMSGRYYAYQMLSPDLNLYLNTGGYGQFALDIDETSNLLYAELGGDIYGSAPQFVCFIASTSSPLTKNSYAGNIFTFAYPLIVKNDGTAAGKVAAQNLALNYYDTIMGSSASAVKGIEVPESIKRVPSIAVDKLFNLNLQK